MAKFDGEIADGHEGRYSVPRKPRGGLGEAQRSRRPEKLHPGLRTARHAVRQRISGDRDRQGRSCQGALEGQGQAFRFSIRPTATASPERETAASPASPRGTAKVSLADKDGGTLLSYNDFPSLDQLRNNAPECIRFAEA